MLASCRSLLAIRATTLLGGISIPPYYLDMKTCNLTLVHLPWDLLCVWGPTKEEKYDLAVSGIRLIVIEVDQHPMAKEILGTRYHGYSH